MRSPGCGGATFVACLETAALLIQNNIAKHVLVFCARNGRSGTRVTGRVNTGDIWKKSRRE